MKGFKNEELSHDYYRNIIVYLCPNYVAFNGNGGNMKTRKEMINALVADDLRIIKQDLLEEDHSYLIFLLTEREPYNTWSDKDIKDAYKNLYIAGLA